MRLDLAVSAATRRRGDNYDDNETDPLCVCLAPQPPPARHAAAASRQLPTKSWLPLAAARYPLLHAAAAAGDAVPCVTLRLESGLECHAHSQDNIIVHDNPTTS